jgi:plastocyanin
VQVAIGDDTFTPQVLKIPAGATVVWTQSGRRPHTVTADDGSFDSHVLNTGDTFQQTFPQPGTVLYYCDLHGGPNTIGMAARLEVERTN